MSITVTGDTVASIKKQLELTEPPKDVGIKWRTSWKDFGRFPLPGCIITYPDRAVALEFTCAEDAIESLKHYLEEHDAYALETLIKTPKGED